MICLDLSIFPNLDTEDKESGLAARDPRKVTTAAADEFPLRAIERYS